MLQERSDDTTNIMRSSMRSVKHTHIPSSPFYARHSGAGGRRHTKGQKKYHNFANRHIGNQHADGVDSHRPVGISSVGAERDVREQLQDLHTQEVKVGLETKPGLHTHL